MMDVLPKVLVKALEHVCEEDILSSCNIRSYNYLTAVSMRFMKPGHIGSPTVIGMRRKSQSHMRLDSERLKTWNSSTLEQLAGIEHDNMEVCDKNDISIDIELNSENSTARHVNADASHASPELTKTKTHVSNAQFTNDSDQEHCDSNSERMPTFQVDSVQNSTQDKLTESTNNVDPAVYFSKIVADFRSVVAYPTLRGLTWNGEIVNLEYKSHEKSLYMLPL